jgi:hypothetical protein
MNPQSQPFRMRNLDISKTDNNMFIVSYAEDVPVANPGYPGETDMQIHTLAFSSVDDAVDQLTLLLRRSLLEQSLE